MEHVESRPTPAHPRASGGLGPIAAGSGFSRFAWGTLLFVLFVVLFGAVVRITGSGAGCGQHWPTCNGEVVHLPKTAKTAIEYTHRLTSGASALLVIALGVLAFRRFPRGHLARKAAGYGVLFMVLEALIGAALVRLRLVENDASALRAIVMPLHLVNTSALTAALSLTAWASQHDVPKLRFRGAALVWPCAAGLVLVLVVSITGAVTALGDTVYPVQKSLDLAARLASDHASGAHFLRQLRIVHPLLAFALAGFLLYVPHRAKAHFEDAFHGSELDRVRARLAGPWLRAVWMLASAQVAAGVLNVLLSAPGYMQVVHLALASVLWIALVLAGASLSAHAPN